MNINILIINDQSNIEIIERILRKYNISNIDTSCNEEKSIKLIKKNLYNLVILDVTLLEINSFRICKQIHKINPDLSVIIITNLIENDNIRYSFKYGTVDYIKKPINEIELISRIENIAKIKQTEEKVKSLYNSILKDLDLASDIQLRLLPEWLIIKESLFFSSLYQPSQKIGGDLFDIIQMNKNEYFMYIGDISGHGIQAALLMTAIKSIINMLLTSEKSNAIEPYKIAKKLNELVSNNLLKNNYLTILFLYLNKEKKIVKVFNAGHPPIIIYNRIKKKALVVKHKGGCPIGWLSDYNYFKKDQDYFRFNENNIFLLYTDGIFECRNEKKTELGIKGFLNIIEEKDTLKNPYLILENIKSKLNLRKYFLANDDYTIVGFSNNENILPLKHEIFLFITRLKKSKYYWQEMFKESIRMDKSRRNSL